MSRQGWYRYGRNSNSLVATVVGDIVILSENTVLLSLAEPYAIVC